MSHARRRRVWSACALLVGVAIVGSGSGCWTLLGTEDKQFTLGDGAAGQGGNGRHPGMVRIEHGDASFYIDATEVTNADYAAWLRQSTPPRPSDLDEPRCDWNTSFSPGVVDQGCSAPPTSNDCLDFDQEVSKHPHQPVGCIDFCDAFAYCKLHGKRLCGGAHGTPIVIGGEGEAFLSDQSEWYFTCSGGKGWAFPYGPDHEEGRCNDAPAGPDPGNSLRDTGGATCEGGFQGVFDMSGNADEWVDACQSPNDIYCQRAGGAYYARFDDPTNGSQCSSIWKYESHCMTNGTGFRCCAD